MRKIEQPVTKEDDSPMGGTITTHPAYAMIGACRVNGNTYLAGSDFRHHSSIRIAIKPAEMRRSLSRDWWHSRMTPLVEVEMSEAQWAAFISTLNVGDGVPATLTYTKEGGMVPGLPEPPSRKDQFVDEMRERLVDVSKGLAKLREEVQALKISDKKKEDLLRQIEVTGYGIGSNMKFVTEQFGEHVETTVEHAKTEVEAYVTGVIQRTGIAALKGEPLPFTLPGPKEEQGR